jgi:hypothetical protein
MSSAEERQILCKLYFRSRSKIAKVVQRLGSLDELFTVLVFLVAMWLLPVRFLGAGFAVVVVPWKTQLATLCKNCGWPAESLADWLDSDLVLDMLVVLDLRRKPIKNARVCD